MTPPAEHPAKRVAIAIDLEEVVPWHQDCCEAILRYGRAHGWTCTVTPYLVGPGGQDTAGYYDGVVGRIDLEMAEAARAQGIPAVNHWMNSPVKSLPSIAVDSRHGALVAGEHLIACGYRSLHCIGGKDNAEVVRYIEGLNHATSGAGLAQVQTRYFDTGKVVASSRETFARFLGEMDHWLAGLKTPAGLMVVESTLANYVVQQCLARGLSVPGDVGMVVWHDDVSTNSISPTLSVIETNWSEVGYQAAALLDELMRGEVNHPQHRLIPPTRLIQRESTDVFLCEDELVSDAMRYIAERCRQTVKIEEVAEALGVARRTLERRFDQALGKTIYAEITRLRVDYIKRVLMDSDEPLATVGFDCGFSNASNFATYFRKATGMSPGAYRKKHAVQDEE